MDMKQKNLLVTGPPGCGKTTLVRNLADRLRNYHPAGFYTAEIRVGGTRQGFELVSLDGKKSLLAHVTIKSSHHVGKYGVDIPGFEAFLGSLFFSGSSQKFLIIDEIGKMECMSARFRQVIDEILSSDTPCIATIAMKGDRFIEEIRQREDATLFIMTPENRDVLALSVIEQIKRFLT